MVFRQIYLFVLTHFITNTILPVSMGYPAGWLVCSLLTFLYYRRADLAKSRIVDTEIAEEAVSAEITEEESTEE